MQKGAPVIAVLRWGMFSAPSRSMLQKQEHLASLRGTLSSGKNIKTKGLITLDMDVGVYLPMTPWKRGG